jgi:glucan 1,3-beta-glucosidase
LRSPTSRRAGTFNAYTFAPINQASDNLAGFASAAGLTDDGTNWVNTYIDGCLKKIAAIDKRIPLMLQNNFKGSSF